jgi:hypothetical protein
LNWKKQKLGPAVSPFSHRLLDEELSEGRENSLHDREQVAKDEVAFAIRRIDIPELLNIK